MPTLLLSTWSLPASRSLADAARKAGWTALALDDKRPPRPRGKVVFYGGSDVVLSVAEQFHLAFLEPPLDLLALLPYEYRHRAVEFGCFRDLARLRAPTFVKPADPLCKSFDPGIYSRPGEIRAPRGIPPTTPILAAEPVDWLAEYRCFILESKVAAWSPYLSFGRPTWKPFAERDPKAELPENVQMFCDRLLGRSGIEFPPAFVVDIGLIEGRGWGVVEFNPASCAGVLGADPARVLAVLDRACQDADQLSESDRRWLVKRRKGRK